MFELQVDELSKKIMGYQAADSASDKAYIVNDDMNKYLVEQKNGLRMLADNLYFIDGCIKQLDNQSTPIIEQIQDKQRELSLVKKELANMGDVFAKKLAGGMTFEEAASYIREKKQLEISLKGQIGELDSRYAEDLRVLYKQRDADALAACDHQYYSSVCLLIKDENEYLEEWIKHYVGLGIDHVYIYDNGNVERVSEVIATLPESLQAKLTVIDYHDAHTSTLQQDVYMHFLDNYGRDTRWVGFLDSDEFVELTDGSASINELLAKYEDHGSLYMGWVVYNANGQEVKTDGAVQERFTTEVPEPKNHIFNQTGKEFMQPYKVRSLYRYHPAFINGNQKYLNENWNKDIAVVNHYYTKSLEEWRQKIQRGSCDSVYRKSYQEFFDLNPDMRDLNSGESVTQGYNTSE